MKVRSMIWTVALMLAQTVGHAVEPDANGTWAQLESIFKGQSGARSTSAATDWTTVAQSAAAFQRQYSGDARVSAAAALEIVAMIRSQHKEPKLSSDLASRATAYVKDKTNAASDRVKVHIALFQSEFGRTKFPSNEARLRAEAAHATELISEYPGEQEGYGLQLAVAKVESDQNARALAQSLLTSAAPEKFKAGAQRVLARLALVGKPVEVPGAEVAIAAAKGHPLVVYAWSSEDAGFLKIIERISRRGDIRFIGVNLDKDMALGVETARALKAPGQQIYDRYGLDGPVAQRLQLTLKPSLYLVDAQGIVRSVDAHRDIEAKIDQIAGKKGAK